MSMDSRSILTSRQAYPPISRWKVVYQFEQLPTGSCKPDEAFVVQVHQHMLHKDFCEVQKAGPAGGLNVRHPVGKT